MKFLFRATTDFMRMVRNDLSRTHAFADERVGFIAVRATVGADHLVLLADSYYPVADHEYLRDPTVGALINQEALRKALEIALLQPVGMFHVHQHLFPGRLWFSPLDLREQLRFVPDFFKVRNNMPHGALVLSDATAAGRIWVSPTEIHVINEFDTVGTRMDVQSTGEDGSVDFYA